MVELAAKVATVAAHAHPAITRMRTGRRGWDQHSLGGIPPPLNRAPGHAVIWRSIVLVSKNFPKALGCPN